MRQFLNFVQDTHCANYNFVTFRARKLKFCQFLRVHFWILIFYRCANEIFSTLKARKFLLTKFSLQNAVRRQYGRQQNPPSLFQFRYYNFKSSWLLFAFKIPSQFFTTEMNLFVFITSKYGSKKETRL